MVGAVVVEASEEQVRERRLASTAGAEGCQICSKSQLQVSLSLQLFFFCYHVLDTTTPHHVSTTIKAYHQQSLFNSHSASHLELDSVPHFTLRRQRTVALLSILRLRLSFKRSEYITLSSTVHPPPPHLSSTSPATPHVQSATWLTDSRSSLFLHLKRTTHASTPSHHRSFANTLTEQSLTPTQPETSWPFSEP